MKARPILMHGRSIRSILAGRKTQTRRDIRRVQGIGSVLAFEESEGRAYDFDMRCKARRLWHSMTHTELRQRCPYGGFGELLWVREAWQVHGVYTDCAVVRYQASERNSWTEQHQRFPLDRATGAKRLWDETRWRPSIHMPRWASRLTLHLTGVRVERVQDISESDAAAEGIEYRSGFYMGGIHPVKGTHKCMPTAREAFAGLWDDTNGPGAWERNDWVWALYFRVIHANVDDVLADPQRYGVNHD